MEICKNCSIFKFNTKDTIKIIPIIYKKNIYGCLSISFNNKKSITDNEYAFLENIANCLALTINRIHLENEYRRSTANYKTIFETTSTPTILDDGKMIGEVLIKMIKELGYEAELSDSS